MTTIQEQMQTGPVRANEILAKLLDAPAPSGKARDRLVSELKGELDRQAEFEEQRLFPVLEQHEETRDLVRGARDDNQRMRQLLDELLNGPKGNEVFGAKVAELRDVLQRHLREDGKELLPAIVTALGKDEAGAPEAGDAKAEDEAVRTAPARRVDGGEHRPEGEQAQAREERREADVAAAGTDHAQQGAMAARIATEARAATEVESTEPVQPVSVPEDAPEAALAADMAAVGRSMVALLNEQARHALQVQTIMAAGRARTMAEIAQVQGAFIAGSFQRMGQFNDRYLAFIRGWTGLLPFPSTHR